MRGVTASGAARKPAGTLGSPGSPAKFIRRWYVKQNLTEAVRTFERDLTHSALREAGGSVTKAAKIAGVTFRQMRYLKAKHGTMKLFAVGDIIRYGTGSTALMQITDVLEAYGGAPARYHGIQCFGNTIGVYHEGAIAATIADLEMWKKNESWRKR
jgi:hypothetical protein